MWNIRCMDPLFVLRIVIEMKRLIKKFLAKIWESTSKIYFRCFLSLINLKKDLFRLRWNKEFKKNNSFQFPPL